MSVKVEDLGYTTAGYCRLDAVQLRTDVELKLRKAGITLLSGDEFGKALLEPEMRVQVLCTANEQDGFAGIDLSVAQEVVLTRDQSTHLYLVTWSVSGGTGQVKREDLERKVRDRLQDQVDKYINAYMSVNAPRR